MKCSTYSKGHPKEFPNNGIHDTVANRADAQGGRSAVKRRA